jgi:hypothetical protein
VSLPVRIPVAVRNRPYLVVRTRRSMSAALTQCFSTRTESLAQLILAARAGTGKSAWSTRWAERPIPDGLRPPGRRDLHVASKVGSGQRRPGTRRVGRLPPSLRRPGLRRGPRRGHPGHQESDKHRAVYFRWPATSGSAPRSPRSPATAATPASGPRRSITPPAPPTKTTCAPSGSWPAPGSASSGLAGSTASPTTPPRHGARRTIG